MRTPTALALTAALAAAGAGCGSGSPDRTAADTVVPSTTTVTPAPAPSPSTTSPGAAVHPAGVSAVSAAPAATDTAYLTAVRAAGHEGYDRVVFEFRGAALPGYTVRYVQPPITEDGSGKTLQVSGNAYLEVRFEPASGVDLSHATYAPTYTGPRRVTGDTRNLNEVVRTGDFEGVLTWVAGLDHRTPFRVTRMSGPARLAVDVTYP